MANIDEEDYLESLLKSMSSDSEKEPAVAEEEHSEINFGEMDNFDTFSFNEPDVEEINTENDNLAEDNNIEYDDSGLEDTSIEDMLRALQENSFDNSDISDPVKEQTMDNEDTDAVQLSEIPPIDDELADILALDDGMSIEDIPEELPEEEALSEEENELINNITEQSEIENSTPEKKN